MGSALQRAGLYRIATRHRLYCAPAAEFLKYKFMNSFDRAIMHLDKAFGFVSAPHQWVSRKDEGDKIIVVERGGCPPGFSRRCAAALCPRLRRVWLGGSARPCHW